MKTPHYLRFVQALVLAAAVPACSSADDPAPTEKGDSPAPTTTARPAAPEAPPSAATSAPPAAPVAEAQHPAQPAEPAAQADKGVDAGLPFSSGPIVPPELPASFA